MSVRTPADVLVVCYGNPGRLDDGLGPAFGEALEGLDLAGITLDVDYQLHVEQAAEAARHRWVIFVDAKVGAREPFEFEPVMAGSEAAFSTHSVDPGGVLTLAGKYFGRIPESYALGIRGYEFDAFGERLSPRAKENLDAALRFMIPVLERRSFAQAAAGVHPAVWDGERP